MQVREVLFMSVKLSLIHSPEIPGKHISESESYVTQLIYVVDHLSTYCFAFAANASIAQRCHQSYFPDN